MKSLPEDPDHPGHHIDPETGKNTEDEKRFWIDDPDHPGHHIDPETGIWPIAEWGASCGRGFVSSQRFARSPSEQVIERTNRETSKTG